MIILDEEDGQNLKLDPPLPLHVRTNRPTTPTPSLPDYETSQGQLKGDPPEQKRKVLPKKLKWALWGLGTYFIITVAIGVPLIVLKSRSDDDSYRASSMNSWYGINGSNPVLPPIFNLAALPVCLDDASNCSDWSEKDIYDGTLYSSHLEYSLPVAPTLFVQSNITFDDNTTTRRIGGNLNVGVNKDPSETDALFRVDMLYSTPDIRQRTNVCMIKLNISHSNGLYVYVPSKLKGRDRLLVNISLELPQYYGHSDLYVSNFITSLPYFSQYLFTRNSSITFGNIALGGYKADLHIDAVNAEAMLVRSPFGGTTGVYSLNSLDDGDDDPQKSVRPLVLHYHSTTPPIMRSSIRVIDATLHGLADSPYPSPIANALSRCFEELGEHKYEHAKITFFCGFPAEDVEGSEGLHVGQSPYIAGSLQ